VAAQCLAVIRRWLCPIPRLPKPRWLCHHPRASQPSGPNRVAADHVDVVVVVGAGGCCRKLGVRARRDLCVVVVVNVVDGVIKARTFVAIVVTRVCGRCAFLLQDVCGKGSDDCDNNLVLCMHMW
jgi:hypothetical protein